MTTIIKTPLDWAYLIEPKVFGDERWFFMETFSKRTLEENWIAIDRIQDNHSKSVKWVLRGMHFQTRKPQDKLVRVTSWAVYDVIIDCRVWSPTYWEWYGIILSAENKKQLLVPKWFAHWFLSLEDWTEFLYKVSDYYDAWWEGWLQWNDEEIWIDWKKILNEYGIEEPVLSEKDWDYQSFSELPEYFAYEK